MLNDPVAGGNQQHYGLTGKLGIDAVLLVGATTHLHLLYLC